MSAIAKHFVIRILILCSHRILVVHLDPYFSVAEVAAGYSCHVT